MLWTGNDSIWHHSNGASLTDGVVVDAGVRSLRGRGDWCSANEMTGVGFVYGSIWTEGHSFVGPDD